jgi:hypothetical protein
MHTHLWQQFKNRMGPVRSVFCKADTPPNRSPPASCHDGQVDIKIDHPLPQFRLSSQEGSAILTSFSNLEIAEQVINDGSMFNSLFSMATTTPCSSSIHISIVELICVKGIQGSAFQPVSFSETQNSIFN